MVLLTSPECAKVASLLEACTKECSVICFLVYEGNLCSRCTSGVGSLKMGCVVSVDTTGQGQACRVTMLQAGVEAGHAIRENCQIKVNALAGLFSSHDSAVISMMCCSSTICPQGGCLSKWPLI